MTLYFDRSESPRPDQTLGSLLGWVAAVASLLIIALVATLTFGAVEDLEAARLANRADQAQQRGDFTEAANLNAQAADSATSPGLNLRAGCLFWRAGNGQRALIEYQKAWLIADNALVFVEQRCLEQTLITRQYESTGVDRLLLYRAFNDPRIRELEAVFDAEIGYTEITASDRHRFIVCFNAAAGAVDLAEFQAEHVGFDIATCPIVAR